MRSGTPPRVVTAEWPERSMEQREDINGLIADYVYLSRKDGRHSTATALLKLADHIQAIEEERDLYKRQAETLHSKISEALATISELNNTLERIMVEL